MCKDLSRLQLIFLLFCLRRPTTECQGQSGWHLVLDMGSSLKNDSTIITCNGLQVTNAKRVAKSMIYVIEPLELFRLKFIK